MISCARVGAPYDNFGDVAANGKPDKAFVGNVLNSFFALKPPKSLDRNSFAFAYIGLPDYTVPDGAGTLSARRRKPGSLRAAARATAL